MELFCNDLKMTALCNEISYSGLCADDCLNLYNRTLINLISQHYPLFLTRPSNLIVVNHNGSKAT